MTHSFLGNKKSWNFHLFSCPPGGNRRRLKAHTLCHRPLSAIVGSGRLATSSCPHPLWVAASAWVLLTSSCPHTWSSSPPSSLSLDGSQPSSCFSEMRAWGPDTIWAGSWGHDTGQAVTFCDVLRASLRSSGTQLRLKPMKNQPGIMKNRTGTMKNHNNQPGKTNLEPWKL